MLAALFLLLLHIFIAFGNNKIVFSDNDSATRSRPLMQNQGRPVPIGRSQFVPSGCEDGADFCEEDPNYPPVNFVKQLIKANSTELEIDLLFQHKALMPSKGQIGGAAANRPVPIHPSQAMNRVKPSQASPETGNATGRVPPQDAPDASEEESTTDEVAEVMSHDTTIALDFPPEQPDFATRFDSSLIEESSVCKAHESYIYPKTAKNIREEWRYVVNVEDESNPADNYLQAVRVERCTHPEEPCDIEAGSGVSTVCRQKYSERKLVAISPEGEKYIDTFSLPSCCICYKKENLIRTLGAFQSQSRINLQPSDRRRSDSDDSEESRKKSSSRLTQRQRQRGTGFEPPKKVEVFDNPLDHDFVNFAEETVEKRSVVHAQSGGARRTRAATQNRRNAQN